MPPETGPQFLKEKYDLHTSPEVQKTTERTELRTDNKLPNNPDIRIQNYLDRLERLALDPNKEQKRKMFGSESRPRALSLLREMIMDKYVRPHKEKMAEGAARVEERAAREMGIEAHYNEEALAQRGEIAVTDLEKSLDNWISYLSDMNEPYPVWFRYYAFRNVLDMGDFDKDKGEFTKRSPGSTRLFPDIDRGALAYVEDMINASKNPTALARLRQAQIETGTPEGTLITQEKAKNFAKMTFSKQYVEGIRQAGEITTEMRKETRGKWVKYGQATDPTALWASLQNKGTAWCTKGFATAETQLVGGDFYVYYTYDQQGKPTIPRVAIRMQGSSIGEVRGVLDNHQNLEGNMVDIAEEKMNKLPGAEKYRKMSADMKYLTAIETKTRKHEQLTKDDLVFLYEINAPIEGFGYQRDPRIAGLRSQREPEVDAPIVFECEPSQIAHSVKEIDQNTKAYIGPLFKDIFTKFFHLEHIYTSFLEGGIRRSELEIGGKNVEEIENEFKDKNINVSDYAKDMLHSPDFTTLKNPERINLVRLKVKDLGLSNGATTGEIYARAEEYGLELCPGEAGPRQRLKDFDQPLGDYYRIAMKQIADRDGNPYVFSLSRHVDGLWLGYYYAESSYEWNEDSRFVFRFRKLEA